MTSPQTKEQAWLRAALRLDAEAMPFPWQLALLERFREGELPRALDLPTGLGKTSVMAIWLVARAAGAPVPRRLVYVVDRRAVVDQATTVAEELREYIEQTHELKSAMGLEGRELPISTLRGQHIDNREWLDDPAAPAIVVGTVDMVGSRLLFEGYGVSRKMRPYHAGFLGVDTLLVLDEAHLVPPFERLVEAVAEARNRGLGPAREVAALVPQLRLLALSATGRPTANPFTLTAADHDNKVVQDRVGARKIIEVRAAAAKGELAERLATEAHGLATRGTAPSRIVVFCDTRDDAGKVAEHLRKLGGQARSQRKADIELFVGGRRAHERGKLEGWLKERGFIAGTPRPAATAFLIATSAGEVGVDLDADAAVADVVAWERMVQRLGRVNRRGVDPSDATRKVTAPVVLVPLGGDERWPERRAASLTLLEQLPAVDGGVNASPGALGTLRRRAGTEPEIERLITEATTPAPLHPPLERPLVDSWAMTSLDVHTGRPEVDPWLRGWIEEEDPEVTITFRDHLPLDVNRRPFEAKSLEAFLEVAGPHAAEELGTEVWRALEWLIARAAAYTEDLEKRGTTDATRVPVALALDRNQAPRVVSMAGLNDKKERERLERFMSGGRLLVDARLGGLESGLLAAKAELPAADAESLDLTQRDDTGVPFRVRRVELLDDDGTGELRLDKAFVVEFDGEGAPKAWIIVERRAGDPISEAGRSIARRAQALAEHQAWAEDEAVAIAARLELDAELARALRIAARLHDEGKKAERWQRAFHVPSGQRPLAKSTRAPNVKALGGYRHELGSLQWVERDPEFMALDEDARDLVLHLVAAHHGRARPILPTDGAEEAPTTLRQRAREVALRFDRLSRRFGPWGLAWLESLLRAADVRASRKNDEKAHG